MRLRSKTDGRPYLNVIFGNFYSPAFDDEAFVDQTMGLIRRLGFNSVMFDTKASEDFRERCETGALSQYVKMQEYMAESALRHGLAYNYLLLYLNGDNLYPHIRFSPPILGEPVRYLDGTEGNWYKYWSPLARQSMKEHADRILERYGTGCERCIVEGERRERGLLREAGGECELSEKAGRNCELSEVVGRDCELPEKVGGDCEFPEKAGGDCGLSGVVGGDREFPKAVGNSVREVIPVCSMWDPVVAPSFDEEGRTRYLEFLRELYHGEIAALNSRYGLEAADFAGLTPAEYWFGVKYGPDTFYTEADVKHGTPKFYVWRDNALWKIRELTLYFKEIGPMLKEKHPELFLCPDLTQWGCFLNIYGRGQQDADNGFSDLWDTALRGMDPYAIAPYVDSCHFITVPVTPDGHPDAYVVSCQHSMMRVMNEGRPLIGGIYWGRYIYSDLYAQLSPAEIIGSMTACGMDGYTCYGMNGLDDGGVMNRMDDAFLESLRQANAWCAEVIALRRGPRKKEIALLFPSEMAQFEPFEVGNNKIRRLDLLGWYRLCCDLGYQADVISHHEAARGALEEYRVLIVPANDCYFAAEHEQAEQRIRDWVRRGGVVLHGPGDVLAERCFGIRGEECEKQPYRYGKTVIAQGESFCRYHGGREIAAYVDDGGCCVAEYAGQELAARIEARCAEEERAARIKAGYAEEEPAVRIQAGYAEEKLAAHIEAKCAEEEWEEFQGSVYSFGVQIGASWAAKNIPHVPYEQGNREMYPIVQSGTTLVKDILRRHVTPASGICERGIETGVFENGMVIVNHRPTPYVLPERYGTELYQYPFHAVQDGRGVLGSHEAVWVSRDAM